MAATAFFALALLASSCGSGNDSKTTKASTTPSTSGDAIQASLGEFFIKLDRHSVPPGNVHFNVSNDGAVRHELVVIKTNVAPDKLPVKGKEADEEVGPSPGEVGGLDPGKKATLTVKLDAGKYVLICNLPGHYKAGQRTGLTVR
jgi:uncharacterized cupredoxin-like copper-binding protein